MKPAETLLNFPRARPWWRGLIELSAVVAVGLTSLGVAWAQVVRDVNTSLNFPQNPQVYGYTAPDAFPGLSFDQPLAIASVPGETDRLFVVEKAGRIKEVGNLGATPVSRVFLDLTSKVMPEGEQGLLGLAFHPRFAQNGYFYVFYSTYSTTGAGTGVHERVARFTALPAPATNAAILATELVLIDQFDQASNHNGGDLHFGPDGYLYISVGDEGGGWDEWQNSQRIDRDFFSGLLRIDVDLKSGNLAANSHPAVNPGTYLVPADNPFVGATSFNGQPISAGQVRTEFWAVGLRNPWRFSFDVPTGRLFAGDVGQDTQEEIDLITRGGNYGWAYREGLAEGFPAPAGLSLIDPLWVPADRALARSIIGGIVYRGSRLAQLYGKYVFADYVTNRIFLMGLPENGGVEVESIYTEGYLSPVALAADPSNGDVLIASIGSGSIRRLVYNSQPQGAAFPATLTATGAFVDVPSLTPAAGLVAYSPNVSFWSDHALKRRWFSVPSLADKISFAADGNWGFPAGTVWVKHFDLELVRGDPSSARRLETRFLVKTEAGVYGLSYRWNAQQTEATLVGEEGEDAAFTITDGNTIRSQSWHFPSRSECLQCHTPVGGYALSFNTAQLNRDYGYPSGAANQLTALANAGYFTGQIPAPANLRKLAAATDTTASLEWRVRSYLAANCVQCHQPSGAAQGNWDARIETPTASAGLVNGALVSSGGDAANRVIVPGDAAHSMLLQRISLRGSTQMPPLGSSELDAQAIALVTEWIASQQAATVAPSIIVQPLSQTVTEGQSVTFTVTANGVPAPTFQWLRNGTAITGATTDSLTIANVQQSDAADYTVAVTSGTAAVLSNAARLTVGTVALAPLITLQPQSQTVTLNASASFATKAEGVGNVCYQWTKDGVAIEGATAEVLVLDQVTMAAAGTYVALAYNHIGVTGSVGATLTVVEPVFAPTIVTAPVSQTVGIGDQVTFSVVVDGLPAPVLQWRKNGIDLLGATGFTLALNAVQPADAGTYSVVATNAVSSVTSSGAVLTVSAAQLPPTFVVQPQSQSVGVGSAVTLSALADGAPAPTYQWRKDGVVLTNATAAVLSLPSVQLSDAGSYTVTALNTSGSATSLAAVLTVTSLGAAPVFVLQPQGRTVTAGSSVTFWAAATGSPAPGYQWLYNGVAIDGAIAASLTVADVQLSDAGSYTVVATNVIAAVPSTAAVLSVTAGGSPPGFALQPQNQIATEGMAVTFSVTPTGEPAPTLQWAKNGVPLAGQTGSVLMLANLQVADAGSYSVTATNSFGVATSTAAMLWVTASSSPPTFRLQPVGADVTAGTTVTLTADAEGNPSPNFQWLKDGVVLPGAVSATLHLPQLPLAGAGAYRVMATNVAGSVLSDVAVVRVSPAPLAPTILVPPRSATPAEGYPAVFTVSVTGFPAPKLQWMKFGAPIPGATGEFYRIAAVHWDDTGDYSVSATNSAGTVTSPTVRLTVVAPVIDARSVVADFNADGNSDLLWQNQTTGERALWLMRGTSLLAISTLGVFPLEWTVAATGDLNSDGQPDIIWSNSRTGERAAWLMEKTSFLASASFGIFPLEWTVAATGDFDHDRQTDLVWSNSVTGERAIWFMAGTNFKGASTLGIFPLEWTIAAAGDFNGDGETDLVWSNSVTGERAIWMMNGASFGSSASLGFFPLEWTVTGAGDYDGDGRVDLIWSNALTGERALWLMNGTDFKASSSLGIFPLEWSARN